MSLKWRDAVLAIKKSSDSKQRMEITLKNQVRRKRAWYCSFILFIALARVMYSQTPDSFNPNANGTVYALALQPDGKVLAGGSFSAVGGQPQKYVARMNSDGTLDAPFNPVANNWVYCMFAQPNGKTLVGGTFTLLGGQTVNRIGRLNVDGTVDFTFNPNASSSVYCLAVQDDGRILVGGVFTTLGGQPRNNIGRLNADGTLDATFNPGAAGLINCLAVQEDGKILVGGGFSSLGGKTNKYIGRLNVDGTVDTNFNPVVNFPVYSLLQQTDGKILVGGVFTSLNGQTRNRIGRLNIDGTLDDDFNPGASANVYAIVLQANGKILVGGDFTTLSGQGCARLGRLNPDGTLDTTFNPGAVSAVYALTTQPDGKVLAGGEFLSIGGQPRNKIARLDNSDSAIANLTFDGSKISWLRDGSSPEVYRTTFEASTNGEDWESLGFGDRVVGGWELTGIDFPTNAYIHARGSVTGGYRNGSSWWVDSFIGPPVIIAQPIAQDFIPGTNINLSVVAGGLEPLTYQWRKDEIDIIGATARVLPLTNVQESDIGGYDVTVTNAYGSIRSEVAELAFEATNDSFNPGPSASVYAIAIQPDGKILVGGDFINIAGSNPSRIARLNADGTLDNSRSWSADGSVFSLALQTDGKVLASGWFTHLGGRARGYIGRFNSDGTLDTNFTASASGGITFPGVYSIAVQTDGKIVAGGDFRFFAGQSRTNIARLNLDGTLDTNFNAWANDIVYPTAIQPDGKIVVGGAFTNLCGFTRNYIGRLNADGSLDTNFNASASSTIVSLAIQADEKILVVGGFSNLCGQVRNYIGRLNSDGTLDTSFDPNANNTVRSIALQADGKILIGGDFTSVGGVNRKSIARLNQDGSLDMTFNILGGASVFAVNIQPDGKILVGGTFTTFGGQARSRLARINNTEPTMQSLTFDGSIVDWQRGATSPEVWRTSFDGSTDGTNWTTMGYGNRTSNGWQLAVSSQVISSIRARGFVVGGRYNCSSWFVEEIIEVAPTSRPLILVNDNQFGFFSNQFGFNISGNSGQIVILEGSTNFLTWTSLSTNMLGNEPLNFNDSDSTYFPSRFYRIRVP